MLLTLSFLGAADVVTGSRTLIEYGTHKWLIDCGQFQGTKEVRERNRQPFKPDPSTIQKIILTHAHLDHSGYLPRIYSEGYSGPIYCTEGTADLSRILLRDAAYLEEEFSRYANETRYSNHTPAIPLFTREDAERAIEHLVPSPRRKWLKLSDDVQFRFLGAGHIIGASSVQMEFKTKFHTKTVTFSGDVGHNRSFILQGPDTGLETDVLVVESTYGNRRHPQTSALDTFAEIYRRTVARGGVLVIPAFAVGRAQEITYMIRLLEDQGRIPIIPVILDSPMSVAAMDVCLNHKEDLLNPDLTAETFKPKRFEISVTPDDSMLACMRDGPLTIISASGMLNGGRILHHLKSRLPDERNTILFCGFQAEGTKGRFLQDAGKDLREIRIHHQVVPIAADIATMEHLSAHGDQEDILEWMSRMRRLPKTVIVNHGTPQSQKALAALIHKRFGIQATPAFDQRKLIMEI